MDMSDDDEDDDSDHYQLATIAFDEDEFAMSNPPLHKSPSAKYSMPKDRSAKESWFPLASFIDVKDDDLSSWNWRNFIEVGGVL